MYIPKSLIHCIHAYSLSSQNNSGRGTLIINSSASSHIVPHWSWFQTYQPLHSPCSVTLGDNSEAHAIRIGMVPLLFHMSGQTFEIVLLNVLLIPEFQILLIFVNWLASASLSTSFLANSNACCVQKDRNTILVVNHWNGLYYTRVTPNDQKEAAHATINVNLLPWWIEHISVGRIEHMVKCGQLWGIDTLSRTPMFCEACTLKKMKKASFGPQDGPQTTWPLEMIHMDVGGPISPHSHKGYKFWLVFVDDFSCFPWIYFMKHKSKALQIYNQWKLDVKTLLWMEICRTGRLTPNSFGAMEDQSSLTKRSETNSGPMAHSSKPLLHTPQSKTD